MTVLILDAPGARLPPYLAWLAPDEDDVVLFTGRSSAELARPDVDGYASVRSFDRWAPGLVDRQAVRLAQSTALTAIVAVAAADAIRAGALRDLLGIAGQGRDDAVVLRDLVAQRRRLAAAGVPTVACGAVQRVSDLYWCGWRWGYPLRVRERRTPGWPLRAVLHDEAAIRRFTRGGLSPRLESVPSLVVEPALEGARHEVPVDVDADGAAHVEAGVPAPVCAALAALAPSGPGAWRVSVVQPVGAESLIDAMHAAGSPSRAIVRAQAGLVGRPRETVG